MELLWVSEPPIKAETDEDRIDAELFGRAEVIYVAIYENAVYDDEATQLSGRPRYRNAPFIAVKEKGTKDFVSRPVLDEDRRRFPRAWKAWEARNGASAGLPLELLPGMRPAQLRELREINETGGITTVEALAAYEGELGELESFRVQARRLVKPRLRLVEGKLEQVA